MTDILRRLREPPFGTETSERNLFTAAADEIERLQRVTAGLLASVKPILDDLGAAGPACAEADGWPEFDRADRYLAPDMFVPLTDAAWHGGRFGG